MLRELKVDSWASRFHWTHQQYTNVAGSFDFKYYKPDEVNFPTKPEYRLHRAYICNLSIFQEQNRAKGFGSLMFQELIDLAYNQNLQYLFLRVVEHNLIARALYSKYGFSVCNISGSILTMERFL